MGEFTLASVLLIRLSSIGDIILTTPLIRALGVRYPEAAIDFVTKQEFAELLGQHPRLRRVYAFDSRRGFSGLRELAREVRSQRYDLIVDLHVNPRSLYLLSFAGAHMTRRYRKHTLKRQMLKRFRINYLKDARPVLERYFTALEDFGVYHDGLGPDIYLDAPSRERAEGILRDFIPQGGLRLIGLAPGASHGTKRWPAARFAKAALRLAEASEAGVVLLGSRQDEPVAQEVKDKLGKARALPVLDLVGKLRLLETAAVIQGLDLVISNDTALMHMAGAVKTPVVAVFGPTSRELGFFPFGENARVVEKLDLECRPCSLHGDEFCPEGHFRCMKEISADQVATAANELLALNEDIP